MQNQAVLFSLYQMQPALIDIYRMVQVVRMGADNIATVMERALEAGNSVLIENMGESIDAVLNPIITR